MCFTTYLLYHQIVGVHQSAANGAQQTVSTEDDLDTMPNGAQYAVCNVIPTKDVKKDKKVCAHMLYSAKPL